LNAIGGPVSLAVRDRKDGKRAALSERSQNRPAGLPILAELGDDAFTAA
jgi:hypothetical protein